MLFLLSDPGCWVCFSTVGTAGIFSVRYGGKGLAEALQYLWQALLHLACSPRMRQSLNLTLVLACWLSMSLIGSRLASDAFQAEPRPQHGE